MLCLHLVPQAQSSKKTLLLWNIADWLQYTTKVLNNSCNLNRSPVSCPILGHVNVVSWQLHCAVGRLSWVQSSSQCIWMKGNPLPEISTKGQNEWQSISQTRGKNNMTGLTLHISDESHLDTKVTALSACVFIYFNWLICRVVPPSGFKIYLEGLRHPDLKKIG